MSYDSVLKIHVESMSSFYVNQNGFIGSDLKYWFVQYPVSDGKQ